MASKILKSLKKSKLAHFYFFLDVIEHFLGIKMAEYNIQQRLKFVKIVNERSFIENQRKYR